MFDAIHSESVRTGRSLWAIGVDEDEHAKFEGWKSVPWASQVPLTGWQARTLTSIVKRLDVVVFEVVDNYFTRGEVGEVSISIESGGIDYVTTGGFVDDIVPMLEAAKEDIRNGSLRLVLHGVDECDTCRISSLASPPVRSTSHAARFDGRATDRHASV